MPDEGRLAGHPQSGSTETIPAPTERPGFAPVRRRLAALLAVVLVLLFLAFAALTREDHQTSLEEGWASVELAAFGAAEHAERTLAVARLVTEHVAAHVRREGLGTFIGPGQPHLVALLDHAPQIGSLWLMDATGRLVAYTLEPEAPPLDFSRRPYFGPLRDGAPDDISAMLLGRVTRLWFFSYNLPIRDDAGTFLGIVQASLHAEEFQRFKSGLGVGPQGHVGLYRTSDGAPVMLYPLPPPDEAEQPPPGPAAPPAAIRRQAEREPAGRFLATAEDGGELLVAWRRVGEGRGVIATAAMPAADALTAFRGRLWRNAVLFGLASLLVAGLGAGVAAALARVARSRREVEAGRRELAALLEATNDGVIALDPAWRITFLSRRGAALLGPGRNVAGQDLRLALPWLGSGAIGAALARTMALRQPAAGEQPGPDGHGALRLESHPREDGGLVAFFRDVTEERAAQQRLAESEARLRQLFQAIDEGYALCELVLDEAGRPRDFRYIEVNPLFTPMTGLMDPVGRTGLELRPVGIEPHWLELYGRVALGGETLRFERGSAALGRWLDVFATPVAPRGRFALVVRDITARRAAEAALRESEERLRRAQQAGGVGVWEVDLASGRVFWSDELRAILGLPPEAPADREVFMALIHPEDRPGVQASSARAKAEPGARYDAEFRIRRADTGEERWLVGLGEVQRDAAGRAIRMVGVNLDVTERRRAAALAESEARLRLAQEAAEAGVFERELPGTRAWWSPGMFRLYGLDPEGRGPWVESAEHLALIDPEDRAAHAARREAVRNDATYTRFDYAFRIRRADTGEQRWIAARGEVVRDAAGRAILVRGINQDITDRRRAEERQMLLAREVDHRAKNALAVVQAIVGLTRDSDPAAFRAAVIGRIAAMARAHNLLAREGWDGAELGELIEAELAPLGGAAGGAARVRLSGPPAALSAGAAQPLAMALHELATNAAKYGALSTPAGTVTVAWHRCAEGGLELRWTERGGPPLAGPPARAGFGSSVVRNTVERQLGGTTRFDWQPAGLEVTLQLPARQLRRVPAAGPRPGFPDQPAPDAASASSSPPASAR